MSCGSRVRLAGGTVQGPGQPGMLLLLLVQSSGSDAREWRQLLINDCIRLGSSMIVWDTVEGAHRHVWFGLPLPERLSPGPHGSQGTGAPFGLLMRHPCCRGQWRPCSAGGAADAAAGISCQPCNDHNSPRGRHRQGKKTPATCKSACKADGALLLSHLLAQPAGAAYTVVNKDRY